MLLQFKVTEDGSLWLIDSDAMRYSRVTAPVTDPEKWEAGEGETEEYGKLVPASPIMEVYRLEGRDPKTEGPGCGLTSVAIIVRILGTTVQIGVSANVPIKDPVSVKGITAVQCDVLGQEKGAVN